MDPVSACQQASEAFHSMVAGLDDAQLDAATPCTDFDVRALIGHSIGGANMFAGMLGGAPAAEPAADADATGLAAAFQAAAGQLASAAQAEGALEQTVNMGGMELPGAAAVSLIASDQVVHIWDLAKAIGAPPAASEELSEFALASWRQMIAPQMRDGNMFADEQQAPEGAATIEKLAAFTGRSVS